MPDDRAYQELPRTTYRVHIHLITLTSFTNMKVSFFQDGNIAVWVDYSYTPQGISDNWEVIIPEKWRPDCVWVFEVDFDSNTQTVRLENWEVVIEDLPKPEETEDEKRKRIENLLITTENYMEVDTEWVKNFDIDKLILYRFFRWDRGKEIGFTQRMVYLQMIKRSTDETQEMQMILAWYEAKEAFKSYIQSL